MTKTEIFIEKALLLHIPGQFDYSSTVYEKSYQKVAIKCIAHDHTFYQTPDNHLQGHNGCHRCSDENKRALHAITIDEFVKSSEIVHHRVYDYSKVSYLNSKTKVEIICKTHGTFFQTPSNHIHNKQGCPSCFNETRSKTRALGINAFITAAKNVHGNVYDYSDVQYTNNSTKIEIGCTTHGTFNQTPSDHIHSSAGCPKCQSSKGERKVRSILMKRGLEFTEEQTFSGCVNPQTAHKLRFDFYIPSQRVLIEFDGSHHYVQVDGREPLQSIQHRDYIKTQFAEANGFNLLRIHYLESNIEDLIITYLVDLEPYDSDPQT